MERSDPPGVSGGQPVAGRLIRVHSRLCAESATGDQHADCQPDDIAPAHGHPNAYGDPDTYAQHNPHPYPNSHCHTDRATQSTALF